MARNHAVSTEITGYAVSAFQYLYSLTHEPQYRDRAVAAAEFLKGRSWDPASLTLPFEIDPPAYTYFFDCGIVVRGLLSAWRATGTDEFLDVASALGRAMARDFAADNGAFHPILALPDKRPAPYDAARWSRSPGCYQLKAAMAWWDLADATGDEQFREPYRRVLAASLKSYAAFLPGHPDRLKVMDRLHAFLYFLEGLLPRTAEPACAAALCDGIRRAAQHLRQIAPAFDRSDVYAQLLRIRLYADWAGVMPLDRLAAQHEGEQLACFQAPGRTAGGGQRSDPRIEGGFYFGRQDGALTPYVNPVSTAFALQALELWEQSMAGGAQPLRHLLI